MCNNWSTGGGICHIEVKQHFLCDLKEDRLIQVLWQLGDTTTNDMFTKNLAGPLLSQHEQTFVSGLLPSAWVDVDMDISDNET